MKRGFTLVELLATIIIIITLAVLITPRFIKLSNDSRKKGYKEIERRLEEAAAKYIVEEYTGYSSSITITKDDLINKKYIDEIYSLSDKSECDATVTVTNINTRPVFSVYLVCNDYTTGD